MNHAEVMLIVMLVYIANINGSLSVSLAGHVKSNGSFSVNNAEVLLIVMVIYVSDAEIMSIVIDSLFVNLSKIIINHVNSKR